MIDGASIDIVLKVLRPERQALLGLLHGLSNDDWNAPSECPEYTVKGIATHILGDDLSLLSRQRDRSENGLTQMATELPGADFRTLLDTFNNRWVAAARFLSPELLALLLELVGDWTADYYETVDPESPGEPVGFFGSQGSASPFWQSIAREYIERWVHHSQIRRALGLGSVCDHGFLRAGIEVIATAAHMEVSVPIEPGGSWGLGAIDLGSAQQAADILTRAKTAAEVIEIATGPTDAVELLALFAGRP